MKPKKKKVLLAGLPGYKDPYDPNATLAEVAHDKLILPQNEEPKEAKVEKKNERKPNPAANPAFVARHNPNQNL